MTAAPDPRAPRRGETEFEPERVVIRDKRRLDPESGAVRLGTAADGPGPDGAAPAGPAGAPAASGPSTVAEQVAADAEALTAAEDQVAAELTADLQRLSAEYANYRKRVERDRVAVVEMATAGVLAELLPLLDDVDRARSHGDLTGPFQAVGEGLETVVGKLGLERFGEVGEPFDPSVHEALMQAEPDPAATVAVCAAVLQPGFRLRGGRVLRPARVSVAEPAAPGQETSTG